MGDPRTGTTISKKFLHCCEGLDPITDFSTWGSSKGAGNPQGICLSRSMDLDYRTATGLGKQRLFKGTNKSLVFTRTQGKWAVTPQETEPDLPVSLGVSSRGIGWQQSSWGQDRWQQQSWEMQWVDISPRVGGHHWPYQRACSPNIDTVDSRIGLLQAKTRGGEQSSVNQQKIGLNICWAWPWTTASPSHQETCTSL